MAAVFPVHHAAMPTAPVRSAAPFPTGSSVPPSALPLAANPRTAIYAGPEPPAASLFHTGYCPPAHAHLPDTSASKATASAHTSRPYAARRPAHCLPPVPQATLGTPPAAVSHTALTIVASVPPAAAGYSPPAGTGIRCASALPSRPGCHSS